jgi:CheY-like chemotaxis protein
MRRAQTLSKGKRSIVVAVRGKVDRDIVVDMLRSSGYAPLTAYKSVEEAEQNFSRDQPNILVFDDQAVEDALHWVRAFRRSPSKFRAMQMVLILSEPTLNSLAAAKNAGVDEMVAKPISFHAMLEKVQCAVLQPRPFVDHPVYVGPCRRRKIRPLLGAPLRRESDQPSNEPVTLEPNVAEAIKRLAVLLQQKPVETRAAAVAFVPEVDKVRDLAQRANAQAVAHVARGLTRYVQAVPGPNDFDPRVLQAHVASLVLLATTPGLDQSNRSTIHDQLDNLVARALKAAAR